MVNDLVDTPGSFPVDIEPRFVLLRRPTIKTPISLCPVDLLVL